MRIRCDRCALHSNRMPNSAELWPSSRIAGSPSGIQKGKAQVATSLRLGDQSAAGVSPTNLVYVFLDFLVHLPSPAGLLGITLS